MNSNKVSHVRVTNEADLRKENLLIQSFLCTVLLKN